MSTRRDGSLPPPAAPPAGTPLPPPSSLPPAWVSGSRPARPAVALGGWLLVAGGIVLAVGAFLPWFTVGGRDFTGFTRTNREPDGPLFLALAIALTGLGIALLVARRVVALAVVLGSLALLAALVDLSDVQDLADLGLAEAGPGLPVAAAGSAVALAGGVLVLAKRRR
jgi:hypothetical protein